MKKILIILIPLLLNVYAFNYSPKKYPREPQKNIYPIKNPKVSSGFGKRKGGRFHWGVDFNAPYGTPVIAPVDIQIEKIGRNENHGNFIIAKDEDGFFYLFAHLSRVKKTDSKYFSRGETIGYVGSSGYSFGPHLHYEVFFNGVYFNPENFSKNEFQTPYLTDQYDFLNLNFIDDIKIEL